MVARQATGSLRDAISLLDQLVAADSSVTLAQAQALLGTASGQVVQQLTAALSANDAHAGLEHLNQAIDAGTDPRQLARQMIDYLRGLLFIKLGNATLVEATAETRAVMAQQANQWEPATLLRAMRAFTTAANDARSGWQPQLPLELAIVECSIPLVVSASPLESASPTVTAGARPRLVQSTAVATPLSTPSAVSSDVQSAWSQTIKRLFEQSKITKLTVTELEACRLEPFDGTILPVITTNKAFLKRFNDRPEMVSVISSVLSEVIGSPRSVKFYAPEDRLTKTFAAPTTDGIVSVALRDLGAERAD
jgi:DNA polymerase-3 subunit gamma/tau